MKKRIVAGLLTAMMVLQTPFAAMAAESNGAGALDVVEMTTVDAADEELAVEDAVQAVEATAVEAVAAEEEMFVEAAPEEEPMSAFPTAIDFRSLPYGGMMEGTFDMGTPAEAVEGEARMFSAADEETALNATEVYSAILPSVDSIEKYTCRGDVMPLYFNLFSRGNDSDMWYVNVRKGDDVGGEVVGYTSGNFSAEANLINLELGLKTGQLDTGVYTVESFMKYYTSGGYVVDQETHYYFKVYITDVRTPINGISLSSTGKQLKIGQEMDIAVAIDPENTTEETRVEWTNSNPAVAEIYNYTATQVGTIEAVGYGTTFLTASVGGKTAVCIISVSEATDTNFPFSDIQIIPDNWKYESVKYVYEKGIMNGISGTSWFQPDSQLNRAMFATVLYRMAGSPGIAYEDKFSDVGPNKYYTSAILWASSKEIVSGYQDGSYGIDNNITREQIAKMLYQYAKVSGYDITPVKSLDEFTDKDEVSTWATGYMEWATAVGLISGKPNGNGTFRLDPKGDATRAECAKMLMMFDQKY